MSQEMSFEEPDYVWENHVVGRLPLREPEEPEIIFHSDQLWQDQSDVEDGYISDTD